MQKMEIEFDLLSNDPSDIKAEQPDLVQPDVVMEEQKQ